MPRLLFCGDATSATGFARVTHGLLDNLGPEWDCHVLAVNYYGDPHNHPYKIYPAIVGGDLWGFGRVQEIYQRVKPDVVVILNDLWVAKKLADQLHGIDTPIYLYFPVDAENFCGPMLDGLEDYNLITYTNFGVEVLRTAGITQAIATLPHGVDTKTFFPMDKQKARKVGKGIGENDFIVLNANRNQPRKRIDLTIEGFCRFAADKPEARLYLHMGKKDLGWDIESLFTLEAKRHGFDPQGRLITSGDLDIGSGGLPSQILNAIYNAADVHINTSEGEGWGLTSHEGAACQVHQIVPNHSACRELFKSPGNCLFEDLATFIPRDHKRYDPETLRLWSVVSSDWVAQCLNNAYFDRKSAMGKANEAYTSLIKLTWPAIAKRFEELISQPA
jgi:glycosyltransferase involved in cell wall biosynthesis